MQTLSATSTSAAVAAGVLTTMDASTSGLPGIAVGQQVQGGTLPAGVYVLSRLTADGTHTTWQLNSPSGAAIPDNGSFTATFITTDAGLLPLSAR